MLPRNQVAGFIYNLVKNQWIIAGMDGMPVDMNTSAILDLVDLYEVENRQETFVKVLMAGRKWIDIVREKSKKK